MVLETIKETGERHGVVTRVGLELGIGSETLRHWVKQAEVDHGLRPGVTTPDRQTDCGAGEGEPRAAAGQ